MTAEEGLSQRVREFVARQLDLPLEKLQLTTDVVASARTDGTDVTEFVEAFGRAFGVNISSFRRYHHSGPEGCNPLWLIDKPWWARRTYIPIRLGELVESARCGVWCMEYPDPGRM